MLILGFKGLKEVKVKSLDQFRFLGNCPPTNSPKLTLTLTSYLGQTVGLGEG